MNIPIKNTLLTIGIPTVYAVILRLFFGANTWNELFSIMSVTFLFLLPTILGALTIYLSSPEKAQSLAYRIFTPWIPVFLFLIITLAFALEGWACWLMILPIFLIGASIGGLIGGYLKARNTNKRLNISILVSLPLFVGPIEKLIETIPGTYKAYTYIDIEAPAEKIWDKVTHVSEIPQEKIKAI